MSTPNIPATSAPAAATSPSSPSSAPSVNTGSPKVSAPSSPSSSSSNKPGVSAQPASGRASDIAAAQVASITGDGGQPSGVDSTSGQAPKQADAAPTEPKKYKIKVNGVEREVTEEQAIRYAQLGYGADEKFREAAAMRRQVEQILETMRADPWAVLEQLGVNPDEIAESRLAQKFQKDLLTPEQRELEELREFRRQQEERETQTKQQQEEEAKQTAFKQQMQRAAQQYDADISQALEKANLPRIPEAVRDVASKLLEARKQGFDLDVETAVELVKESDQARLQSYVGKLQGKALLDFLGEHVVRELRKHDLEMIRARRAGKVDAPQAAAGDVTPEPQAPRSAPTENRPMKTNEWMEMIRKRAGV